MSSTSISTPVLNFPIKGYGASTPKVPATPAPAPPPDETILTPELEATILSTTNFRELPQEVRLQLLKGPSTTIIADGKPVGKIPFRLLLTASTKVKHLYSAHGSAVPADITFKDLDHAAAHKLIAYLQETATKYNCFYLTPSTFVTDLSLLHTASRLGMQQYVHNVSSHWFNTIKSKT